MRRMLLRVLMVAGGNVGHAVDADQRGLQQQWPV